MTDSGPGDMSLNFNAIALRKKNPYQVRMVDAATRWLLTLWHSYAAANPSMRHALVLSCSMPEAEASRGAGSKEEGVFNPLLVLRSIDGLY